MNMHKTNIFYFFFTIIIIQLELYIELFNSPRNLHSVNSTSRTNTRFNLWAVLCITK